MSRGAYGGPKLPKTLLDQVGGVGRRNRHNVSRKDRRQAERKEKKAQPRRAPVRLNRPAQRNHLDESDDEICEVEDVGRSRPPPKAGPNEPRRNAQPVKSILKPTRKPEPEPEPATESETDVLEDVDGLEDENKKEETFGDEGEDGDSDDSFTISRHAAKAGLAGEDDEIAALERKLGIKGKKRTNDIGDDELDWLVAGSDSEEEAERGTKRKRPDDAKWLRDKRLKAAAPSGPVSAEDGSELSDEDDDIMDADADDDGEDEDGLENPFSADELSDEDFASFESEEDETRQKQPRENPYVAPVSKADQAGGKYVPPSLRKAAASDEEALERLRRQIQGQLNRLSEANLLSILQAVEEMYERNARQHMTSTLIEFLIGLASDPSTLNDTFIILHAGFAAALYKVIGTDFGAQLLERLVETFDHQRHEGDGKQTLNLIAFLSNLYALQVVGSGMMFDYIRMLLNELSEANTELLLRVIRSSGPQLRQDDPTALKDIVVLLQRSVAELGEANTSVRTKFMIETINNLKNNRMKSNAAGASAMAAEHLTRMRKTLGTLNTRSNVRATEPLRITLADIRDSEKKGKWWLVGASYHDPAKLAANGDILKSSAARSRDTDEDAGYESETPGKPNLARLAREQGMNTDVRRAIFISILSAVDVKDAHLKLTKLNFKAKQQLEIPRVILHCAAAESKYNPYYTLIARKVCGEYKMKKAFQFALLDILRRLGEGEEADEDEDDFDRTEMTTQKIVSLAKLYGTLIAEGALSITVLKTIEFAFLGPKTQSFVDVCLTTILLKAKDVGDVFSQAQTAPGMIKGLQYYMQTALTPDELVSAKKEVKKVTQGCKVALGALQEAAESAPAAALDEDDSE